MAEGPITDRRLEESTAKALTFAPVEIAKEQSPPDARDKVRSTRRQAATSISGAVEIELKGGDRMRVEGRVEAGLVVSIISALRRMITFPSGVRVWVFTIGYVAKLLGEDEDWLYELSISMFPEDRCLHVYGVGEDGVTAFTQYGIECLKRIVDDERAAGRAPKPIPSAQ